MKPHQSEGNSPLLSCLKPLFRSKAKGEAIDMEITFYSHANKTHFQNKGFALGLVLKLRNGLFCIGNSMIFSDIWRKYHK